MGKDKPHGAGKKPRQMVTNRQALTVDRDSLVTAFLHANSTSGIQRTIPYLADNYVTSNIFIDERTASQNSLAQTKEINKFVEPLQSRNNITGLAKDMERGGGAFCFPSEKSTTITIPCLNEKNELIPVVFTLTGPLKELDFGGSSEGPEVSKALKAQYAPFVALYIARQMESKKLGTPEKVPTAADRTSFLPQTDDYKFLAEKLLTETQGYLAPTGVLFQQDLKMTNGDDIMGYNWDLTKTAIIYDSDKNNLHYDIHNINYALSTVNADGKTSVLYNANNEGLAASREKEGLEASREKSQDIAGRLGLAFAALKAEAQNSNPMDHLFKKNDDHIVTIGNDQFYPIASKRVSFEVTPSAALDSPEIVVTLYAGEIQQKDKIENTIAESNSPKSEEEKTGILHALKKFGSSSSFKRQDSSNKLVSSSPSSPTSPTSSSSSKSNKA